LDKVGLVGHSDGGTIALQFAAAHPERVSCLLTVAAHVYVEAKMESKLGDVERQFRQEQQLREGLHRVHGEKFEQTFQNWFDGWRVCECAGWDMRPELATITCPTLVVQGTEDEHATPQHAVDTAAAVPGATLWLVEGARHMLPQESAEQFNPRLLEFLRDHMLGFSSPNGMGNFASWTAYQGLGFPTGGKKD
jgi:pimeloyl-ACP methyl ester carboxylesterase